MGTPGRVEDAGGQALNRLLDVFAGEPLMAHIGHDAEADTWTLAYAATWLKMPSAFPLSPALPLVPPDRGYDSRSVKRFIEHLLPERHALEVAVASNGLASPGCRILP